MKRHLYRLLLLFGTVPTSLWAQDTLKIYDTPHQLLVETIQTGAVSGVMTGKIAEHLTRELNSPGPLFVTSRVIGAFTQVGCKRIEVTYTKKDVATPKGPTDAILTIELNYCVDGSPPR